MKRPGKKSLRLAAHALRWAGFGYKNKAEQFAVGEVRLWLLQLAGYERRPHLIAEHAFLYAINTSEFYATHMKAAEVRSPRKRWRQWVRQQVMYRYHKENEAVWLMPAELYRCARQLQRYYEARVAEMD